MWKTQVHTSGWRQGSMCSTVGFTGPRARMDPPLPTEGRGRRGMEGEIAEDRISLHEGSLVKVGRRVRNGNPFTPAQSVCAKYRHMRSLNLLPHIFKILYPL